MKRRTRRLWKLPGPILERRSIDVGIVKIVFFEGEATGRAIPIAFTNGEVAAVEVHCGSTLGTGRVIRVVVHIVVAITAVIQVLGEIMQKRIYIRHFAPPFQMKCCRIQTGLLPRAVRIPS